MLTREENETLTRVGRGTPGGEFLRRYWLPAACAGDSLGASAPRWGQISCAPPVIQMFSGSRGRSAGPAITSPVGWNREPWHGHSHVRSVPFHCTRQPR